MAAPAAGPAAGGWPLGLLLVALPVSLVGSMIIWPIASAVGRTLFLPDGEGGRRFTVETYLAFVSDPYALGNLGVTLWTTGVCAALLLLVCLPTALYLRFAEGPVAAYVQGLAIFPLFVPSIILSYAVIRVLGPNGTVDVLLNAVGLPGAPSPYLTPWGPVIGLVWDNMPLTVLILLAGLGAVPDASVEAARDVGAGRVAVLVFIVLPRIANSVLVAVSFTVLSIFSAFTLPYVLGPASPEMMGPFMQRTFRDLGDPTTALTQAVVTFGFCIVFGLFYVRAVARNRGR